MEWIKINTENKPNAGDEVIVFSPNEKYRKYTVEWSEIDDKFVEQGKITHYLKMPPDPK
jgi:hypothetical protein